MIRAHTLTEHLSPDVPPDCPIAPTNQRRVCVGSWIATLVRVGLVYESHSSMNRSLYAWFGSVASTPIQVFMRFATTTRDKAGRSNHGHRSTPSHEEAGKGGTCAPLAPAGAGASASADALHRAHRSYQTLPTVQEADEDPQVCCQAAPLMEVGSQSAWGPARGGIGKEGCGGARHAAGAERGATTAMRQRRATSWDNLVALRGDAT